MFQERDDDYKNYKDLNSWWRGDDICSDAGWRLAEEIKQESKAKQLIKVNQKSCLLLQIEVGGD